MSECHSVWLSEIIHIPLKIILRYYIYLRGGREQQKMQSKTTVLLKSWKKQRKLHHPHFLRPQSQKLPQRSEKSACSKQNAPPWHLLDLAESNPAQTLWSKREEWRVRHRLIIYVKHVSSPNLQDRERHSIYTANILFVFFEYL